MRHRKKGKKLGRTRGDRQALMRSLAGNMILRERMTTTEARAKAVRPVVERAVTIAKRGTLSNRRLLTSRFHDKDVVDKLMSDLGPRYKGRAGGYTRIRKTGVVRKRDGVRTARIEFV